MSQYIYIYPSIEIIEYNNNLEKVIVLQSHEQQVENRSTGGKKYRINKIASEILLNFNGTKTYDEIVTFFMDKYSNTYDEVDSIISNLLSTLTTIYKFEIKTQDSKLEHKVNFIKYKNLYPTVVSLELTDKCNIRCKHCYGDFGRENINEIPKEKLYPIINSLKEVGVESLELTGGDPSVYPYLIDAIDIAYDAGIKHLMILTNGINLSEKLINTIIKYKENLFVQIDLHSLDDEYFEWFTGAKNAIPKIKENIIKLISNGVKVRVCSVVTPKNYHEILDIAKWSYDHGAARYAISPVIEIGRANKDLLFSTVEDLEEFNHLYELIQKNYPNLMSVTSSEDADKRTTCGAIINQCSIKANGDIKMCTMSADESFNLNLGNIFDKSLKTIFDENYDFINEFSKLRLPKKNSDECKDCKHSYFCDNCFVRGFLRAQDMVEECGWYKNCVSSIIKEHFPIRDAVVCR